MLIWNVILDWFKSLQQEEETIQETKEQKIVFPYAPKNNQESGNGKKYKGDLIYLSNKDQDEYPYV